MYILPRLPLQKTPRAPTTRCACDYNLLALGNKLVKSVEKFFLNGFRLFDKLNIEKMREAIIKADVGVADFRLKVEGSDGFAYNAPSEEFVAPPANLNKKFTFDN